MPKDEGGVLLHDIAGSNIHIQRRRSQGFIQPERSYPGYSYLYPTEVSQLAIDGGNGCKMSLSENGPGIS